MLYSKKQQGCDYMWFIIFAIIVLAIFIPLQISHDSRKREEEEIAFQIVQEKLEKERNEIFSEMQRTENNIASEWNQRKNNIKTKYNIDKEIELIQRNLQYYFAIDLTNEVIIINLFDTYLYRFPNDCYTDFSSEKIIPFSSIISVTLKTNNTTTTTNVTSTNAFANTNTANMVKRAAIGGVIAGGTGAVIGAMTSNNNNTSNSTTTTTIQNQIITGIEILLSDIMQPSYEIIINNQHDKNINEVYSTLVAIQSQNK